VLLVAGLEVVFFDGLPPLLLDIVVAIEDALDQVVKEQVDVFTRCHLGLVLLDLPCVFE
jgi:hypothetical protein